MLYFALVPTDMLCIALLDFGSPAPVVPQYWQRAAGFDETFIAQTESKQRVKFAREHDVAAMPLCVAKIIGNKNSIVLCIISLMPKYIKFLIVLKVKNIQYLPKDEFFSTKHLTKAWYCLYCFCD